MSSNNKRPRPSSQSFPSEVRCNKRFKSSSQPSNNEVSEPEQCRRLCTKRRHPETVEMTQGFFQLSQSQSSLTVHHAPNASSYDNFNILHMPQLTPLSPALFPSTSHNEIGQCSSEQVKLRSRAGCSKNRSVQHQNRRFGMYITGGDGEEINSTTMPLAGPRHDQQQQIQQQHQPYQQQHQQQYIKRSTQCTKSNTLPAKVPVESHSSSSGSSTDGSPAAQFVASSSQGWERQRLNEVSPAVSQDPRVMEIQSPERNSRPRSLLSLKKLFKKKYYSA